MNESHDELQARLVELHQSLAAARSIDPATQEVLHALLADIERLTGKKTAAPAAGDSLIARLTDSMRHFEETHPNLSGAVGSVIDALSRMGI